MTGEPSRHHYVPECYQRGFANTNKQLWTRKKNKANASICTPGMFCYETDANKFKVQETMFFNNLIDQNHIEKNSFKKQENEFPRTRKLVTKFSLLPIIIAKDRYRLFLETLISIKRRNPQTRNFLIKKFTESYDYPEGIPTFKKFIQEEFPGVNVTDSLIQEYFSIRAKDPDRIYDAYLSVFLSTSDYNIIAELTETLYDLKQFILHSPIGVEFITSDNPGFIKEANNILNEGGFGGEFEYYFPISPNACLYINALAKEPDSNIQKAIYPELIDKHQVSAINQFTKHIANARLFGYTKQFLEKM